MAVLHARAAAPRLPLWTNLAAGRTGAPAAAGNPDFRRRRACRRGASTCRISWSICPGARSFAEALDWTAEVYRAAGALMKASRQAAGGRRRGRLLAGVFLQRRGAGRVGAGDRATAGFKPGEEVAISLDIAASEFGRDGRYRLALDDRQLDSDGMIEMLGGWLERYPIVSIEDPLAEDDEAGFREFTRRHGARCQVDRRRFSRHQRRSRRARPRATGASTPCSIKPNQAGTITETHAALDAGRRPVSRPSFPPAPAKART